MGKSYEMGWAMHYAGLTATESERAKAKMTEGKLDAARMNLEYAKLDVEAAMQNLEAEISRLGAA